MNTLSTLIASYRHYGPQQWRSVLALSLIGLLLCFPVSPIFAAEGDLDLTFGNGGKVITQLSTAQNQTSNIRGIKAQSDGKLIAVGDVTSFGTDFAVVRYNTDGSLDSSFGIGGIVITDFSGDQDTALGVAIQGDGKIVAVGYSFSSLAHFNFALARYNTDGSLDLTFGSGGRVTTDFSMDDDEALAVAILTDGKILVAGLASDLFRVSDFALVRYNVDGSLDTSFGTSGKVTTDFSNNHDVGMSLAIQADGKVVIAGSSVSPSNYDFALARYNTDGTLDPGFGIGGKVTTDFSATNDEALGVSIQPDNKIVAVGGSPSPATNNDFVLARYNNDGSLDNTFGAGGKVSTDFFGEYDRATAVVLQSDQKIVVTGTVSQNTNPLFGLARYDSSGNLDTSFGDGGRVTTDFSTPSAADALLIQADNKIVAAGNVAANFALARYKASKRSKPSRH
jgi:uncharacterized delta-60 repeat protein